MELGSDDTVMSCTHMHTRVWVYAHTHTCKHLHTQRILHGYVFALQLGEQLLALQGSDATLYDVIPSCKAEVCRRVSVCAETQMEKYSILRSDPDIQR